jgi:hypothetical protein
MATVLGAGLFALGMVLLLSSKHSQRTFLFIWLSTPWLIFTFLIQNKQARFMMPSLVPVALVIAFGAVRMGSIGRLGRGTAGRRYAALWCLALFVTLFVRANWRLRHHIVQESRADWKMDQIVSTIEEDMIRRGATDRVTPDPLYLGVVPDHHYVNGQTIRYYTTSRRLPLNVIKLVKDGHTAAERFAEQFDRYDYILTKSDWGWAGRAESAGRTLRLVERAAAEMDEFFYSRADRFERLETFSEPDGSEVVLFRRRR